MTSQSKNYQPARLVRGNEPRVEFYVLNPATGLLVRKRKRVPGNLNASEKKAYARKLIDEINLKLRNGWNPLVSSTVPRSGDSLVDAIDRYIAYCAIEMRENSMRSYRSFCKRLVSYLEMQNRRDAQVSDFMPIDAVRIMEKVAAARAGSPRTFNNYLMAFRRLWNWLIEHKYTDENVFADVRPKRLDPKYRIPVDEKTRKEIANHLRSNDLRFLVICELIYFCLLRPNEIVQITPRMVNLKGQVITIPAEVSKNKREQHVTIPDAIVQDLAAIIDQAPCRADEYLFSDGKTLTPGKTKLNPRSLSKRWARMRKKLNLSPHVQLYSLKDSGITDLILNGVPANEVMHQARHHSLEVTSVYIKRAQRTASDHIKRGLSEF